MTSQLKLLVMKERAEPIKVTAEDVTNGERGSASRCPIALAAQRQDSRACVGMDDLRIHGVRVGLPLKARIWIRLFDYQLIPRKLLPPLAFTPDWRKSV